MKIGIYTQPLYHNYGGILQNYALQTVLKRMGHEPLTLDYFPQYTKVQWCISMVKRTILWPIKSLRRPFLAYPKPKQRAAAFDDFVKKYIVTTPFIARFGRRIVKRYKLDAIVVGSDQVWRPLYNPRIEDSFLAFARKDDIRRVAYAVSFGVDEWEFSQSDEIKCVPLAKLFDAISVREESGIRLCREHLGVDATHVLDPTLLLSKEDYIKLVNEFNEPKKDGNLFCYVLDESDDMNSVINHISKATGYEPFYTMAYKKLNKENETHNLEDCVFPRVTEWLRSFMDAEMVVTDSFHGCVFSIIFNKPFWVIGNENRGMARFESLLSTFDLKERMVTADGISKIDLNSPIDWNVVEEKRKKLINYSTDFLTQYL